MAEGPEEARGRPPGQDDGGGDPEPVPSLRGPPAAAAAPRPRDGSQAEPQVPGRPPALGLAPAAAAAEESQPPREPGKPGEAASSPGAGPQEPAGCEVPEAAAPRERPARLSAREYSRQVHEWLWQSYCGYLTWHSGLAALPAYCSPQPPTPSCLSAAGAAPPAGPQTPQLGYYNPFYFLSAAAAGPEPGAAPGVPTPAPVAGLGPRAPHGQAAVRAAPVTRVGSAAPSRAPSETGRQAGETRCGGRGWAERQGPPRSRGRAGRLVTAGTCLGRPDRAVSVGISLRLPRRPFAKRPAGLDGFLLDLALRMDCLPLGTSFQA